MKCVTTMQIDCDVRCDPKLVTIIGDGKPVIVAGTVIDEAECPTADCVRLVRYGLASPVDDECREAAALTPQQIAARQEAMRKMCMIPPEEDDDDDDGDEEDFE